jgi:predicted dehydrogenase
VTRAAIVGTGYVARVHAHALRELGVPVVAACGRSTTREFASEVGATPYDDLETMLDAERPDVLHVCTPNDAHIDALAAAERGIHVVCEKPLAVSSEEASALVAAAEGVVNATCYHARYYPLARRMRDEVAAGAVGPVTAVHGRYACDDLIAMPPGGWRTDPAASGSSYVVADLGTHWLDLVEWMTGLRITEVLAEFRGEPLEHLAALLLRFDNGAVGSVVLTAAAAGRKNQLLLEVEGESGGLTWDQEEPNVLLARSAEPTRILVKEEGPLARYPAGHAEGYGDAFRNLFADVYRAVAGEQHDAFPTFADGARGVALVEAAVRSAREGRWVSAVSTTQT